MPSNSVVVGVVPSNSVVVGVVPSNSVVVPAGQGSHMNFVFSDEEYPGSQSLHEDAPVPEDLPASHSLHS